MKSAPLAAAVAAMTACSSVPQHSNALIFGTTTMIALDVSTDAAKSPGVTLGYKRAEGVWVPLMANRTMTGTESGTTTADCFPVADQSAPAAGQSVPAPGACPGKFIGKDSVSEDTYSVLASFGGDLSGDSAAGAGPRAGTKIKQFFATGLAARKLAESGGAALLNTAAEAPNTAQRGIDAQSSKALDDADRIVKQMISASGDTLDATKRDAWVKAAGTQTKVPPNRLAPISAMATGKQLRSYLRSLDVSDISALAEINPTDQ